MAYTYTQAVADFPATPSLLTGAACLGTDDSTATSVGVTYAQLRTALFKGGTGYASNDPLNASTLTVNGATLLGAVLAAQADSSVDDVLKMVDTRSGHAREWRVGPGTGIVDGFGIYDVTREGIDLGIGSDGVVHAYVGLTIASGQSLQLGSTYSAGAVLATGTIAIKDATGTTYNVLVHT